MSTRSPRRDQSSPPSADFNLQLWAAALTGCWFLNMAYHHSERINKLRNYLDSRLPLPERDFSTKLMFSLLAFKQSNDHLRLNGKVINPAVSNKLREVYLLSDDKASQQMDAQKKNPVLLSGCSKMKSAGCLHLQAWSHLLRTCSLTKKRIVITLKASIRGGHHVKGRFHQFTLQK